MAKRSGLGRGLDSLLSETTAEVGTQPDTTVALNKITPNRNQPRKNFDQTALDELADSIKQHGILQPLLVRKKGTKYEIVAGERRYQAAKLVGLEEVPVVVRDISDEDVFRLALIENLQREDLNPIEEARGYKTLIEKEGLTQEELAKVLSKSRPSISNTMRLLELPKQVQDMMVDGKLTAGHARAILAVPTEDGRKKLAEKVVTDHLTVRQTETLAPLFSGTEAHNQTKTPTPQSFKHAARQLRLALDANVKVKRVRNKNKIEIEFADEEELEHLVRLLSKATLEGDEE